MNSDNPKVGFKRYLIKWMLDGTPIIVCGIIIKILRKDGRPCFKVRFTDKTELLLRKTYPSVYAAIENAMEGIAFSASSTFFRATKQKRNIFNALKSMNKLNRLYLQYIKHKGDTI